MKVDINNNLSFLDTLSCGLGGIMVLFFIFAALHDEGAVANAEIPVEISGSKPMPIRKFGNDKTNQPIFFGISIDKSCKFKKVTDEKKVFLSKSNGVIKDVGNSYFVGSIWNDDLQVQLELEQRKDCKNKHIKIYERNSKLNTIINTQIPVNGKLKLEFSQGGFLFKVNSNQVERKDGK